MENELAKKGKELFLKSKGCEKMSYGAYFKDPDNNFIWDVDHAYLEAIKSELTEPIKQTIDKKQFLLDLGYVFCVNGNIELMDKSGGCIGFGNIDVAYDYAVRQSDKVKPIVEFVEDECKVKGYIMKPEFRKYEKVAVEIAYSLISVTGLETFLSMRDGRESSVDFQPLSACKEALEKAGVLNIWFEPVYEEVKEVDNENKSRELIFNHNKRMIQLEFKLKETLDLVLKAKIDYAG
jgi:hypothetical protein